MTDAMNADRAALRNVLESLSPICCLDIGARGNLLQDLTPIAWAVHLYGVEPDIVECERLNRLFGAAGSSPFKKVRFFPCAIGKGFEKRTLHVASARGSSSLFPPIASVGKKFSREKYVTIDRTVEVDTVPLDDFVASNGIENVNFLKMDVEGAELEILQSGPRVLSSDLVAMRLEVSFLQTRHGQPLYWEIEKQARSHGFVPMGFVELHSWRRLTRAAHTKKIGSPVPFSRGQLAHGDMLFFLDEDVVTSRGVPTALKAAFLAMIYGYMDHAYYLLSQPEARSYVESRVGASLDRDIAAFSTEFFNTRKIRRIKRFFSSKRPGLWDG